MKKFLHLISLVSILCFFYSCSDSDSDNYFEIFENEINKYKYSDEKYYIEKKDEFYVDYYFGIFPNNILIFRDYSLLDSNNNIVLNLHLWREGALKEDHGDVISIIKMDYNFSIKDSFIVKEINHQSSYGLWGPYENTTIIETSTKNKYIIKKILIRESLKDTLIYNYNYNHNNFINHILTNIVSGDVIKVAYDGNVVVEQIYSGRIIHILDNLHTDKLSEYFNNWTTLYYYDENFRLVEEKYIEYGNTVRNNKYFYSADSGNEIVTVYDINNNLIRKIIKTKETL